MQNLSQKIDAPNPDSIVVGRWTLRQVVALMDRLAGAFAVVDLPNAGGFKHSVLARKFHLRVPVGPNPIRNGYATRVETLSRRNQFRFNPNSEHDVGLAVWEIYISHHKRAYRSEPWRLPYITSEQLQEFCDKGEIQFVSIQGSGIEADLDFTESFISRSEQELSTIGPWLQKNLWISLICHCKVEKKFSSRELFGTLPPELPLTEALKRLRCRECDSSGVRKVTPYLPNGLTAFERYRTVQVDRSDRRKTNTLENLYTDLGGDGEGSMYLSDKLWIDPDGSIHE